MKRDHIIKQNFNFEYGNILSVTRSKMMFFGLKELVAGNSEDGDKLIQEAIDFSGYFPKREREQLWKYTHKKAVKLLEDLDWHYKDYLKQKKFYEEDPKGIEKAKERGYLPEAEAERLFWKRKNAAISDPDSFYNYLKNS